MKPTKPTKPMKPTRNGTKAKRTAAAVRTVTRGEAIDIMRRACLSLTDDEHSLCQVASELQILCRGFSQWKSYELKERFEWIARNRPHITRAELEDLANRWQLARQLVRGTALACDTQQMGEPHQICRGWDTHGNQDLARYVLDLTGEQVRVVGDEPPKD